MKRILERIGKFFSRYFVPFEVIMEREVPNREDNTTKEEFVSTRYCQAIEKDLRNRMRERTDTATDKSVSAEERMYAIQKREELADILMEWEQLRQELAEDQE